MRQSHSIISKCIDLLIFKCDDDTYLSCHAGNTLLLKLLKIVLLTLKISNCTKELSLS